jgi:16S rRNA processing protein RimM|tara:strand:+ start:154 stop:660 length:507 start_codon:yes stop_codon:yes gene_type:complete
MNLEEPIIVGKIGAPWGVQGWVRVKSYTRHPGDILNYPSWMVREPTGWQEISLICGHPQGECVVVEFEGYNNRERSKELNGLDVGITPDQLAKREGDFYWVELQGMAVITLKGETLGKVNHLLETGANDVLVVADDQGAERLIPWGKSVIDRVDRDRREIWVEWEPDY